MTELFEAYGSAALELSEVPKEFSCCEYSEGADPCYYCGIPADTVDHVLPRTIEDRLDEVELGNPIRTYTVPCCRECNTLLGAKWYPTLTARKLALKKKLRKRYRKFLEAPSWEPEEMVELGETLRSHISRSEKIRELTRERLRW